MRKKIKWIIVPLSCLIFLLAAYPVKFLLETRKMSSLKTQEIIPGVYSLKDSYVNMYLLKGKENYIAIDAGTNINIIRQEIKKLNIDPEKVRAVLLTHTDSDHVSSLDLFKNAKIYISEQEEQMINGKTWRFLFFINKHNYKYTILKDNDVIIVEGLKIKCILTPGHTPGSMSYIIDDKNIFTGDNLSLKSGKVNKFNNFFNMDSKVQMESLKKLSSIKGIKYIFTAHYGFSDDFNSAFKSIESI